MYNVLIIGAGGQGALADAPGSGNGHKCISFAHAAKVHPGFNLNIIIDKDKQKAEEAAKIWGFKHYCNNFMSDTPIPYGVNKIDVAIVATPDCQHYWMLKYLADFNIKLVICEKPLCTDLQQAREIVALYKEKSIPLMVNYTRRFLPYYEDLKRRYEAGEFGGFRAARYTFNRGWLHSGSHGTDFMSWFFNGKYDDAFYNDGFEELDVNYRIWQLEIFFENYHWREERIGDMPVWPYYDQAMLHVVNNVYEHLEGREPLKCSGEDALKTLEVCCKLMGNS